MDTGQMENEIQLAIIGIAFQFLGLFVNIGLSIFQGLLTEVYRFIFEGIAGAFPS